MREFVKEQDISNYYEVGRMGIEHVLLPERDSLQRATL